MGYTAPRSSRIIRLEATLGLSLWEKWQSDDRVYGDMCGITFQRQGTIGWGSDKCDFFLLQGLTVCCAECRGGRPEFAR